MGISLDNPEYKSAADRDRELDETATTGSRWVRFDIKWSDVQSGGPSSFSWAKYDGLVNAAKARGFSVLANLAYTPSWARPSNTTDKYAPDTTERREAYARFVTAAVTRYRDRISVWEIWNEPNNTMFWQPAPNASSYTALLRDAFPAVKAADPSATVIAGATSPAPTSGGMIDEVQFIQGVYAAGGRNYFDAWSHHPYDFNLAPGSAHPDSAWWQMYGSSPSIRSVMEANGDAGKKVWGTEYGLPSSGYGSLTEAIQADRLRTAFTLWRGYAWAGPIFNYMVRDALSPGNAGYWYYMGVTRNDWSRKPSFAVMQQAATS
jgi:hypothetical protein